MLGWIKKKLFVNPSKKIPADRRKLIDPEALHIVKRLQDAGFESYLVGGCVRDLLLGIHPKDFDIATAASPQQVKSLINRSFIIGKRFRIVVAKRWPKGYHKKPYSSFDFDLPLQRPKEHEYQVTTFRRAPVNVNGIINENVFGSAKEDAQRRDFTLNALFLDPSSGKIVDFVDGIPDLNSRRLRVIGDPWVRFKEDPIRLLRALRFMMRAGLHMTKDTQKAFEESLPYLADAKKERIREELLKIFKEGSCQKTFKEFQKNNVWRLLNKPLYDHFSKTPAHEEKFLKICGAIDRCPWKHSLDSSPLFGLMLLPLVYNDGQIPRLDSREWPPHLVHIADELKISKKEREDLSFGLNFLDKILKDPEAKNPSKLLFANNKKPELLIRHFYMLKICADAEIASYGKVWKNWSKHWQTFHDKELLSYMNQKVYSGKNRQPSPRRRRRMSSPPGTHRP